MNRSLLLHVVERLESLVGKLPATIQKPILSELTPLKELFLQQRPPRFILSGSDNVSNADILQTIFSGPTRADSTPSEIFRWKELSLPDRGTFFFLDARGLEDATEDQVKEELTAQTADAIVFLDDCQSARGPRKNDIDNLRRCAALAPKTRIIGVLVSSPKQKASSTECAGHLRRAVESDDALRSRFIDVFDLGTASDSTSEPARLLSVLARELPNESRIEMIRISQDKNAQREVAHILIKSTTAICTAIGAQPIPLADMPILTTLQLMMVSGIMYVSGREKSLRAATEFIGALGVNLGAGFLLREGARAILKFFPGWGNLVSGMVAGAGTYAIGRAATVFFLEGVSLKEARRTYLTSRKRSRAQLPAPNLEKQRNRSQVKANVPVRRHPPSSI